MAYLATQSRRKYLRVRFKVPAAMTDEAAGLLVGAGALGCAVVGDHRSSHRRANHDVEAYFESLRPARLAAIWRAMTAAGMLAQVGRAPAPRTIADPGWATAWRARFVPLAIGRRLLIVPPWKTEVATRRTRVTINPGQAFGTGHHATTAGALRALEALCAARSFARGLDVGTGSGVLAIAMRLMGVGRVTAIDIDPRALDNARENAALNSLANEIRFATTPLTRLRGRYDLIAANILSGTLISMAGALTRRLAGGGRLVLGGILNREAPAVLAHYAPHLRCVGVRRDRGWSTLVMAR
ncbi:MAG TPA: 50S ribosomal protein L11 methyltransferase [Candidatus Binataceae bacterium]|nr:50S ribosomal protein L11 methyltransferase [Candidatus Binataceae bacterium]